MRHSSRPTKFPDWTLFLDRDGVINRRLPGAYVRYPEEMELLPGVPEAIARLNRLFARTCIVTNQQGIGKGLLTVEALDRVHAHLLQRLRAAGAHIDAIYFCPHLASDRCDCRKPRPGMARQAQKDFPAIRFNCSLMAGDSISDMQWGAQLGMQTAWIRSREAAGEKVDLPEPPSYRFAGLPAMADFFDQRKRTSVAP